jgi:lipid-binding SYLF domain-containing protein
MKRMGILFVPLMICALTVLAQDNRSSSSSSAQNSTSTTTNSNASGNSQATPNDNNNAPSSSTTKAEHKAQAQNDENAADQKKENASNEATKGGEERDKVIARLDDSSKILNELLAAPDKGIPEDVFKSAKCVAIVPSMAKGGFIFGAEHGRGVATCRTSNGWSAPAFFVITGGSWGAQIGGQAADVVMLIMNQNGMNQLLNAEFKLGGTGSVAAGPVGREASASSDWKLRSEVLTYSRTRGLFAGLTLNGAVIKQDEDSTRAFYGRPVGFRPTLLGQVKAPAEAEHFLATVRRDKSEASAETH